MEMRALGNTGTEIPAIGVGTWRYRGGVEPLRAGIALGARFIDTAEMYGTEGVVGDAIEGIRDQIFLATKVLGSNLKYREILKAADNSLRKLRIDCIDLYQIHWHSSSVPIAETMGAMEELVDLGKVRFVGVSNFSTLQLQGAREAMGKYEIVSNQVEYSLANRKIEPDLLPYCQQNQITVIAYSPLDQGGLTSKSLMRHHKAMESLERVAGQTGKTLAQVSLSWCLTRPWVVVIPKANRVKHVEENCGAVGWSLTNEQVAELDSAFGGTGFLRSW